MRMLTKQITVCGLAGRQLLQYHGFMSVIHKTEGSHVVLAGEGCYQSVLYGHRSTQRLCSLFDRGRVNLRNRLAQLSIDVRPVCVVWRRCYQSF
jgi:hypothetical protein